MKILRENYLDFDHEFPDKCIEESHRYIEYANALRDRDFCKVFFDRLIGSKANSYLPNGKKWSTIECLLIDNNNQNYADCKRVIIFGEEYVICPDAYENLDEIAEYAVNDAVKEFFGTATLKPVAKKMTSWCEYA